MNLKARFFQLYTGETVKIDLWDGNWRLAKLNCVDRDVVITDEGGFLLEKCQLVLTPIEELIDSHASSILNGMMPFSELPSEDKSRLEASFFTDKARSFGYCLPYMGKDPFNEGWAISELPPVISFTSL